MLGDEGHGEARYLDVVLSLGAHHNSHDAPLVPDHGSTGFDGSSDGMAQRDVGFG